MKIARLSSWRAFIVFLLLYAACMVLLLGRLSLWLDEILDLKGVRDCDLAALLAYISKNAGGVPLGYLVQAASIHVFGYSIFSGRLPSALFSLIACVGIFVLGRRLQLRFPLAAVLIFCLLPLQLRYALEARPYSQALALTVWATVGFLNLVDKATFQRAAIYGLLVLACLYTQPYTLFVPVAHFSWACSLTAHRAKRHLVVLTAVAIALAILGSVPWYLYASQFWGNALATYGNTENGIGIRAARMVAKELVGAGYPGTALIVCAAWLGLRHSRFSHDVRTFWGLYATLPIALAVLADAILGYFLAIREMLWVLAPLSLLAAAGIERLAQRRRGAAMAGFGLLLGVLLFGDVRFFLKPREDWQAAAALLQHFTARGACVLFEPANSSMLYGFFAPQLPEHSCPTGGLQPRAIAIAVSPYGSPDVSRLATTLSDDGFTKTGDFNRQGPSVELYERTRDK